MRILSKQEADQFLMMRGLKIGNWNEITDINSGAVTNKSHRPPKEALPLYVFAEAILSWVAPAGWTLLQIDNSTAPTEDEKLLFERLVFLGKYRWNVGAQKSFLFDEALGEDLVSDRTALVLLVFFSLVFEWHVHLTSEHSAYGQRLALQDGIVYFFGDLNSLEGIDSLINQLITHPLVFPQ